MVHLACPGFFGEQESLECRVYMVDFYIFRVLYVFAIEPAVLGMTFVALAAFLSEVFATVFRTARSR